MGERGIYIHFINLSERSPLSKASSMLPEPTISHLKPIG